MTLRSSATTSRKKSADAAEEAARAGLLRRFGRAAAASGVAPRPARCRRGATVVGVVVLGVVVELVVVERPRQLVVGVVVEPSSSASVVVVGVASTSLVAPRRRTRRPPSVRAFVSATSPLFRATTLGRADRRRRRARGRSGLCAGVTGLEPATCGFGDRCAANCATPLCGTHAPTACRRHARAGVTDPTARPVYGYRPISQPASSATAAGPRQPTCRIVGPGLARAPSRRRRSRSGRAWSARPR